MQSFAKKFLYLDILTISAILNLGYLLLIPLPKSIYGILHQQVSF